MSGEPLEELRAESLRFAETHDCSDEALAAHRALTEANPRDPAGANRLGIALVNRGELEQAEALFADAVAVQPENAIARRRLDEIRSARAAGRTIGSVRSGQDREEWPEYVEHDPGAVRAIFDSGTDNWRAGLSVVAAAAPARLSYGQVDDALGWPRGRWRSVIGGTRSADGEAKRPYHICSDYISRKGEWEIWMDENQAAAIR